MTKKEFVKSEREFTIDLLKKLKPEQWSANTLCRGWTVEDLAAHLVTRERNVIGGVGLVVPSLQQLHDKRLAKVATHGHEYIIEKLQNYPWYMPASVNVAEFWIHNEDLIRGELHMSRSAPTKQVNVILWGSLKGLVAVRKSLLKDLGNVTLENIDTNESIELKFEDNRKTTTVTGSAGELLLFFYGRRDAAKVKLSR
ncbi:MAG: hypothetical protein QG675_358 [Patescibacteria group bacterium]|jgi:uncharacterized protein (TIGR03085 family)|nr:hypothetical protein [Patescibacteria group bacterium]